jgi:hypothetical protein
MLWHHLFPTYSSHCGRIQISITLCSRSSYCGRDLSQPVNSRCTQFQINLSRKTYQIQSGKPVPYIHMLDEDDNFLFPDDFPVDILREGSAIPYFIATTRPKLLLWVVLSAH